jgi:putative transposase
MKRTFKYRIYANSKTLDKAKIWLNLCCDLYNCALEERMIAYKTQGAFLSFYDQNYELPDIKREFSEYKSVGSEVLQDTLHRLDLAYKAFFRRIGLGIKPGFPRFKGRNHYDSFTLKLSGWHLENRYLWIHKIGRFKLNLSQEIKGKIKAITIRRTGLNKWYASFSCDDVPKKKLGNLDNVVGLDMGISNFLTDSEGSKVNNPKFLQKNIEDLRKKQQELIRCNKNSKHQSKAKVLVSKVYEKITNQRNDFIHKTANYYITNYGVIVIEDLDIRGMIANKFLAKSINDTGWGKFFRFLYYKAEEAGRTIIHYPRFKPSSKLCSLCGEINKELKLSDRKWVCRHCGTLHNRDENAAKNLKKFGQNCQKLNRSENLCV